MKLPKTVKIGGITYNVLFPYQFAKESDDYVGLHSAFECTIRVSKRGEFENRNKHKILSTLVHECIHAVDFWMHPNECTEDIVLKLERAVMQLILDNEDITKVIPKRVRIGSNWYIVKLIDKFDAINCIRYSFVDAETCVIELANFVDGDRVSTEAQKVFLFKCILNLMMVEYVFTIDEVEIIEVERMAFGLYTFLKDNNIYDLIKRELVGNGGHDKICNRGKKQKV